MSRLCLALGLSGLRVIGFLTDPWLSQREIHRVVGEPARVERPATTPQDLQVVTWNIERGTAYPAILAVLRRIDADVVLLQEVDRQCRRTEYRDVARDLAHALEMTGAAAGKFQDRGGPPREPPAITGQAILSK